MLMQILRESLSDSFLTFSSTFNMKCSHGALNKNISQSCNPGCVDFTVTGRNSAIACVDWKVLMMAFLIHGCRALTA
jgi:hypothetical protein